jgi:hypothetical protein
MTNVSNSCGFHESGGNLTASLIDLKLTFEFEDVLLGIVNNLMSVIGLRTVRGVDIDDVRSSSRLSLSIELGPCTISEAKDAVDDELATFISRESPDGSLKTARYT